MVRTSHTDPIRVDFVPSHLLHARGALGIAGAPGRRGTGATGTRWARDLDLDLARLRRDFAVDLVVSLLSPAEQHAIGVHGYRAAARAHGLDLVRFPIAEGAAPAEARLAELVGELSLRLDRGSRIAIHCRSGRGRSGMVAACVLAARGVDGPAALEALRALRPGAVEKGAQEALVLRHARTAAGGDTAGEVAAWVSHLRVGEPVSAGALRVFPVLGGEGSPTCRLAADAIAENVLEVTEKDGGTVPELLARNRGSSPVLILEGDTLVGCRQNRVVTHSVLIAAGAMVTIPVGCMEQGRWTSISQAFASGAARVEPTMRAHRVLEERVSGRGHIDQGRLWNSVSARLSSAGVATATSDYNRFAEAASREHAATMAALAPLPGQTGVIVARGGHLVGIELAGVPQLWSGMATRTLRGYLAEGDGPRPSSAFDHAAAVRVLRSIRVRTTPGVGLGQDLVVERDHLVGTGLWHGVGAAHLAVFNVAGAR